MYGIEGDGFILGGIQDVLNDKFGISANYVRIKKDRMACYHRAQ